jgi:hypothetical protein
MPDPSESLSSTSARDAAGTIPANKHVVPHTHTFRQARHTEPAQSAVDTDAAGKIPANKQVVPHTHTFGQARHTEPAQSAADTLMSTQHNTGGLAPPTLNSAVPVTGETSHIFRIENKR